jgi:hypothetical protein
MLMTNQHVAILVQVSVCVILDSAAHVTPPFVFGHIAPVTLDLSGWRDPFYFVSQLCRPSGEWKAEETRRSRSAQNPRNTLEARPVRCRCLDFGSKGSSTSHSPNVNSRCRSSIAGTQQPTYLTHRYPI